MANQRFDTSMSVFGHLSTLPDLAKQYLFQTRFIFETRSELASILDSNELMIRARQASLPAKSFTELDTQYMGTKLLYPGRATVSGDLTILWDEFQDMIVSQQLHKWANCLMNQGFSQDIGGGSNEMTGGAISNIAADYCATIEIKLYDSTLKKALPVKWYLYRCWPKTISDFGLDHNADGKVTRSATFSYSNFEIIRTDE
jgi:hypothetical protein